MARWLGRVLVVFAILGALVAVTGGVATWLPAVARAAMLGLGGAVVVVAIFFYAAISLFHLVAEGTYS